MFSFLPGFEWDEDKRGENLRKHGVDFFEAVRIFDLISARRSRSDERQAYRAALEARKPD
jgi:uncharacterized DUF497 family protein